MSIAIGVHNQVKPMIFCKDKYKSVDVRLTQHATEKVESCN